MRNIDATLTSITCRHSVERDLGERPHLERCVETGVVDENVDRAAPLHDLVDERLHGGLVGDVRGEANTARKRFGGRLCPSKVGHDDARSLRREPARDRVADALRRPRDDRDLAVELAHRCLPLLKRRERGRRQDPVLLGVDQRRDLGEERLPLGAPLQGRRAAPRARRSCRSATCSCRSRAPRPR